MSYNDRIDAAIAAINEHNVAVGEGNPGFLDPEKFISCVKATGGTNEERLSALSHEDLLACMPDGPIKPRVLAKEVADLFRNKKSYEKKTTISSRTAEKLTFQQLIESFDPEDCENSVGKRLAASCRNEPFIVYSKGRIVNVETTYKLFKEVRDGYPGRDAIKVGDEVKKVYRLGELPDNYVDENPLYVGRPLRPDGTCDQTGRSWEGVDLEVRQFIRVAIDSGELKINHEMSHNIMDIALQPNALNTLSLRYFSSSVKFNELKRENKLPILKMSLQKNSKNPLKNGEKVEWSWTYNYPKQPKGNQ